MYKIYKIEQGDTIYSVANKFQTTKEMLEQINGFDADYKFAPNNFIIVPSFEDSIFMTYKVKKGDNTYQIAKEFNIPYKTLLKLNGLDENEYIYPEQEILIPKRNVGVYITEQGDTMDTISKKTGVSTSDLASQNEIIYVIPEQLIVYKKEQNI